MSDDNYFLDDLHVNHTGRSQYDVEKNLETPFKVAEQ